MNDSPMRVYVKNLSDADLLTLWMESEEWEQKGVLPESAFVRWHIKTFMGERHDMVSFTLMSPFFFGEVWREVAIRASFNDKRDAL